MRDQLKRNAVRLAGVVMAAPLALAVETTSAGAATAELSCNGTLKYQTVSGDVRVPDGGYCLIDHSTIRGNLIVGAFANVLVFSSTVDGYTSSASTRAPIGAPGAYLNAWNSTFNKTVGLTEPWGTWISQSRLTDLSIGSCYRRPCLPTEKSYRSQVVVNGSTLTGFLAAETAQTVVENSSVAGGIGLNAPIGAGTGLLKNVRTSGLSLSSTETTVCGSTVTGPVRFDQGSHIYHRVGNITLGSADRSCAGNQFQDMTVTNYAQGIIDMHRNVVTGKATSIPSSASNGGGSPDGDVTLRGFGNRFTGGTEGAFTAFAAEQDNARQAASAAVGSGDRQASRQRSQSARMANAVKQRAAVVKREAAERGAVRR